MRVLLLLLASCNATTQSPPPANPPPPVAPGAESATIVANAEQARAAVGKRVRFEGRAGDAKLSAAVVKSGFVVYCLDRSEWKGDLSGKNVAVEGTIEYTEEFAAGKTPEGGEMAGTGGGVFVMRKCDVR